MLSHYRNGNENLKPNVVSFSTVINGWAKCASKEAGAAQRAGKVFKLMLNEFEGGNLSAKPNSITYCSLIDAYVKSRDAGALECAEDIYDDMFHKYISGNRDHKPSTILANQIMDKISKSGQSGAGEKAENILKSLNYLYLEYGDRDFLPNDRSYTMVINAYAKSRQFRKASNAKRILKQMISSYNEGNITAKPNVFSFTAVINACAFTIGDEVETKEALRIATAAYKSLEIYDTPNHVTYSCFLRACLNLIPEGPSQESALLLVFRKCRDHGQVTEMILQILSRALSKQQVETIVGINADPSGNISIDSVPTAWKV